MYVNLYTNNSDNNTINKNLTLNYENINIIATKSIDYLNFEIILDYNENYLSCNYAYISSINKYCYINDFKFEIGKKISLILSIDVLETYKNEILDCIATVTRNENVSLNDIADDKIKFKKSRNIQAIACEIDDDLFNNNSVYYMLEVI